MSNYIGIIKFVCFITDFQICVYFETLRFVFFKKNLNEKFNINEVELLKYIRNVSTCVPVFILLHSFFIMHLMFYFIFNIRLTGCYSDISSHIFPLNYLYFLVLFILPEIFKHITLFMYYYTLYQFTIKYVRF